MNAPLRRVLVCGAQGFIGRHIVQALREAGFTVRAGVRVASASRLPGGVEPCPMDFAQDTRPETWHVRVSDCEAVINAVGVLREQPGQSMDAIHHAVPAALFSACANTGVRRVLQVSALMPPDSRTRYAQSKRQAEAALLALRAEGRLDACVLRPSVVFGEGGASTALFQRLARLPWLPWPAQAVRPRIQPIRVEDLAAACARLLTVPESLPATLDLVGPERFTLPDFIAALRQAQGRRPAQLLVLPAALGAASARMGDLCPSQPWGSETLALLGADNIADAAPLQALLGRTPRSVLEGAAA
ncbi:NAD-dependent epimerase/dehydratase family protein [Roseateles sp. DB2]|uniref:NAD-dependent epimerase/dehydratase family protein n=1 Tax=Roseateles sp. DB2 TaxID=3453717 RepID=UPI003EEC2021